jgi:hypothetical protein
MSSSQMSISKMSISQMFSSQMSVSQTSVCQMSIIQMTDSQMPIIQMTVSQMSVAQMSTGQMFFNQKTYQWFLFEIGCPNCIFIISSPDLRKEFDTPPYSQQIQLGGQAELRCHPPKGNPEAKVTHWLKNGAKIENDPNFIQSAEGHLLILQVSVL